MSRVPMGFFDLVVVLAFAAGWFILEWQCRRLDRQKAGRTRAEVSEPPA